MFHGVLAPYAGTDIYTATYDLVTVRGSGQAIRKELQARDLCSLCVFDRVNSL